MPRPPKPIEQHLKDGTYRKDRHGDKGVVVQKVVNAVAPPSLSEYARQAWNIVVPELVNSGLVASVDLYELEDAFVHFGIAQECMDYVRSNYKSIAEYLSQINPRKDVSFINEYNKHMRIFKETLHLFGVTPAFRAKISAAKPEIDDEEEEIFKQLFG